MPFRNGGTTVDGNRKNELTYKITEYGLLCRSLIVNDWLTVPSITFKKIMDGDYKVVTKPWKPKKGEPYWYYRILRKEASCITWCFDNIDLCRWKAGNRFKTREEAEAKGKEIMEQIKKEYEEA